MKLTRKFTRENTDCFQDFQYETRTSLIRHSDGSGASKAVSVEVPTSWSQTATDILAQKYLCRHGVPGTEVDEHGNLGGEHSIKQVVDRLAGCWKYWGEKLGYFNSEEDAQIFYDETVHMLLAQMAAPNSPQWFNTGLHWKYGITGKVQGHFYVDPKTNELSSSTDAFSRPQPHACFIQSVEDDLLGENGLYNLLSKEGRIFKYGSGTGTNFSGIRARGEPLKGGGSSSGLMSFLKVFDRAAGAIKSGGTTRRAAKMVCLDLDHPEIEEFITWKSREEAKVAAMVAGSRLINAGQADNVFIPEAFQTRNEDLRKQGLTPIPSEPLDTGFEGEAYATVSGQNSNNSVRVPNKFIEAVETNSSWNLTARTNGKVMETVNAKNLWDKIALAAWESADPGVQYSDTINEWHTCPKDGPIRASNPCSEYLFLDDTACNLASLNLVRFQDSEGNLKVAEFKHAIHIWTVILDISVGMAQFPSREIAQRTHDYRTLGLGYANLGGFLMRAGIAYDSEAAAGWTAGITAILGGEAYATSAEMAAELGAFPRYSFNREDMLRVIHNHTLATGGETEGYRGLSITPTPIDVNTCPPYLAEAARNAWYTAFSNGKQTGYRNAQVTVIAPTGTIGLIMDCDTTGIEPDFSLVKFKKLSGGGMMKIVNRSLPIALQKLGYNTKATSAIVDYCLGSGTLEGAPFIDASALVRCGFSEEKISLIEKSLSRSLSLCDAFSPYLLGSDFLLSLGISTDTIQLGGREILMALGFAPFQIDAADHFICGTQTIEGAPFLDEKHYSVFDCANPCGSGTRCVSQRGHLAIMAAAQPFLSGAISKTVNLPHSASVADVKGVYQLAWSMMIKAVAIYRDGSKLSQPLNSKAKIKVAKPISANEQSTQTPLLKNAVNTSNAIPNAIANPLQMPSRPAIRLRLPTRRGGFVQEATISGHKVFLRTGEYPDGSLGEIFIDMYKEGAAYRGILNCFAVLTSKALQYGVPLEELVDTFTFTRFEPSGPVEGHDNIKNCTSILDLIFRVIGLNYLGKTDFVHIKPVDVRSPHPVTTEQTSVSISTTIIENTLMNASVSATVNDNKSSAQLEKSFQMEHARRAGYTGESCTSCGSVRVKQNGTCVVCDDCGTTSGCS